MNIDQDLTLFRLNQPTLKNKQTHGLQTRTEDKDAFNKRLRSACDGFEEIFVHKLFQVMRSSSEKEPLLNGGRGEEIFQDMLDENYAKLITQSRALGLSDVIYEHTKKD